MKTLYIDCGMGAAGDMLSAALLELLPDRDAFLHKMNGLCIPGVKVSAEKSTKCGIAGTHFCVEVLGREEDAHIHDHPHHHGSMGDIRSIVNALPVPSMVKLDILAVYNLIAEAESHVHDVPVEQIHFHEVGTMDAIADITAVCLLLRELDADRIIVSPVNTGSGTVRCAHGVLPVPAPATAYLLQDIPACSGSIQSELCTPTGAALLKYFADDFGDMPAMKIRSIGYGMGKKDFSRANCVRALLGEASDPTDDIAELCCNVDDMTGEAVGFALETLMEQGALDAFTLPIGMKKSRPGLLVTVLCKETDKEKFVHLIFKHTTTLGIREKICHRYTLERKSTSVDTPYGPVQKKESFGYGVQRSKYEYEDLARIAKQQDLSIAQVLKEME